MSQSERASEGRATRVSERLAELRMGFEAYRAKAPNIYSRRFPRALHESVLSALDEGVSPEDIMVACRLTRSQLDCWQRKYQKAPARGAEIHSPLTRVLNVVDDQLPEQIGVTAEGIEIRIGRWQLQLRLEQASPSRG
jgi:hypothetical protein